MSRLPVAVLGLSLAAATLGCGAATAHAPAPSSVSSSVSSGAGTRTAASVQPRRSLPTKAAWLAKVRTKLAGADAYLDAHADDAAHPAIVLDIDNTSLATHYAWPKAVKPTLRVARHAVADGYTVFFVTGRTPASAEAARKPLTNAGYVYEDVFARPQGASLAKSKEANRARIEEFGYTVLLDIGNRNTDFAGDHVGHAIKLPSYHGLLS